MEKRLFNQVFSIIAMTYEARAFGVKRGMSVKEAKKVCPSLEICVVPNLPTMNKADLSRYKYVY